MNNPLKTLFRKRDDMSHDERNYRDGWSDGFFIGMGGLSTIMLGIISWLQVKSKEDKDTEN